MYIKQGREETTVKAAPKLDDLLKRVSSLAKAKAEISAEETAIKKAFEGLRDAFEGRHGLKYSYSIIANGGCISVSFGSTAYELAEAFAADPEALRKALKSAKVGNLFEHFRVSVAPDQKKIKDNMCPALLELGKLKPKASTVSLKSA